MKLEDIGSAVENLPGVGPATAKQFARLNIFTAGGLLSFYPRDYEDRTQRVPLSEYASHPKVHTICKVTAHSWIGYGQMKTLKIAITDGSADAYLVAFGRAFLENSLPEGSIISVTGSFQVKYGTLQSTSFEASRLAYDGKLSDYAGTTMPDTGVQPVYHLTEGLSQKTVQKAVGAALKQYVKAIDDEIPEEIRSRRNLLHKADAIKGIHTPQNVSQLQEAKKTLIYEELYSFEYKMACRALEHRGRLPTADETAVFETGGGNQQENRGAPEAYQYFSTPDSIKEAFEKTLSPLQKKLLERLTFTLTEGQMQAITEMNTDIDKSAQDRNSLLNTASGKIEDESRPPFSMQRLLQGDVGSGKTLVSFFACLRTIDYGEQCALLAPTELLARQHAENAAKMLEPLGVNVAFLTGNLKAKGRKLLLDALQKGDIDIAVGTHALFAQGVVYKQLALAVIDEQHRFGVTQRESIIAKGRITQGERTHSPDVLMMSATPIPQTLALTVFGDLDISSIRTMPCGRKPIRTYVSVIGHESNVYEAVRKELAAGHQAYFVYPRIGGEGDNPDTDDKSLKSAEEMFTYLSHQVYPEYTCALVHSKVDEDEQHHILNEFKENKVQVLVATTVVEVGVDVPNATCIVIEHADRFGLAELHQLRGRVGRGNLQSFCFLVYGKNITETGKARLKALHETTDGFRIAEEDLKLRGPGEVSGTEQSGYLSLGIADISRDKDILAIARYDAFEQLKKKVR